MNDNSEDYPDVDFYLVGRIAYIKRLKNKLHDTKIKMNDRVIEVKKRFLEATGRVKDGEGNPLSPDVRIAWDVSGEWVVCKWEIERDTGGYDEGSFQIPLHFLYDDKALRDFERDCRTRKGENVPEPDVLALRDKYIQMMNEYDPEGKK